MKSLSGQECQMHSSERPRDLCQEAAEQRMLCQALLEVIDLFGVKQIVSQGRTQNWTVLSGSK